MYLHILSCPFAASGERGSPLVRAAGATFDALFTPFEDLGGVS
jgi:hypothetical protein